MPKNQGEKDRGITDPDGADGRPRHPNHQKGAYVDDRGSEHQTVPPDTQVNVPTPEPAEKK